MLLLQSVFRLFHVLPRQLPFSIQRDEVCRSLDITDPPAAHLPYRSRQQGLGLRLLSHARIPASTHQASRHARRPGAAGVTSLAFCSSASSPRTKNECNVGIQRTRLAGARPLNLRAAQVLQCRPGPYRLASDRVMSRDSDWTVEGRVVNRCRNDVVWAAGA